MLPGRRQITGRQNVDKTRAWCVGTLPSKTAVAVQTTIPLQAKDGSVLGRVFAACMPVSVFAADHELPCGDIGHQAKIAQWLMVLCGEGTGTVAATVYLIVS